MGWDVTVVWPFRVANADVSTGAGGGEPRSS